MKFFCLCLSPAIDALVKLPCAPSGTGEIFKDVVDLENAGGKAINVARWLALRGANVVCGGLLGKDNTALFEQTLATCGVQDAFLRVPGSTRRNEMFTWPGGAFKVNRTAFENVTDFPLAKILAPAHTCNVAILSGSLPKHCPPSFYGACIQQLKSWGLTVVLDASGRALKDGIAFQPDLIKPNAEECQPLIGFVPNSKDAFLRANQLLKASSSFPIISDGAAGAWFDGAFASAPEVQVVDTTAAGDTLLAEWCWQYYGMGKAISESASWAVAAGSAAVTMPGSEPPPIERVMQLFNA